jgi:hypothetical protein
MFEPIFFLALLMLVAVGAWRTRQVLPFRTRRVLPHRFQAAPFAIDKQCGAIYVKDSPLVLRPGLPKSEFLDSDLYRHTTRARSFAIANGAGHTFLVEWHDPVFENIYLWLKFANDQLGWVDFGWGRKIITAEWTRELVDAEVERYRSFLMHSLQVNKSFPHELPWGRLYACLDEKAGAPAMGIVYRGFEFHSLR